MHRSVRTWGATVAVVALLAGGCSSGGSAGAEPTRTGSGNRLTLTAVSAPAAYASGGALLVSVKGAGSSAPRFALDGHDVTAATATGTRDGETLALVSSIPDGRHRLVASRGSRSATLEATEHPQTGPIFSGPHVPLFCSTEALGLGPSMPPDCTVPTMTSYMYRTTAGAFAPLADPSTHPADLAQATVDGRTVPYIVRYEKGVINRSPYWIAVLDPDAATEPSGASFLKGGFTGAGWNQRLVYEFGGGCGTSYTQGSQLGTNVLDNGLLSVGYAVTTGTFNTFQTSCNDVLSAETALMVKQHFEQTYGPARYTIGYGASGGAIQQLMIAQNYPGILDALAPVIPFPDAMSIAPGVVDCGLLGHYFSGASVPQYTAAQKAAISGYQTFGSCQFWVTSFLSDIDPGNGCGSTVPKSNIYNATTDPKGIRCTLQDYSVNLFGRNPATGFAYRPLDNTGIQYGYGAMKASAINLDQFLDLNTKIGGYDIDGQPQPQRMVATTPQLERMYRTGRILLGGGTTRTMPIITVNLYTDPAGDIHTRFRLFAIRARLSRDGHQDRNEVIWTFPGKGNLITNLTGGTFDPVTAVKVLDQWLAQKAPPAEAQDSCVTSSGQTVRGADIYTQPGPCRDDYPVFGDTRTAAGEPLIDDIGKCRLTAPVRTDYPSITDTQWTELRTIFPDGVCDWSQPGVGQEPLSGTWFDFSNPQKPVARAGVDASHA